MSEVRGPAGVRHAIAEFYREWLPAHAAAAAVAWQAPIPVPASVPGKPREDGYFSRELAAIDRWPVLAVTSGRVSQRETDREPGGDVTMTAVYPIRVYSWVKAEGWDATQDLRDNLATVVRIATLAHLRLGTVNHLVVDPSTLVVDFSRLEAVSGDRFVAGSFVGFNVRATETLTDRLALPGAQPRDTVGAVHVDGIVIPLAQETP